MIDALFDTGANGVIINKEALKLITQGNKRFIGHEQVDHALEGETPAGGEIQTGRVYEVDKITIGGLTWKKRRVVVKEHPVFERLERKGAPFGLVGVNLMSNCNFMLDLPNNQIRIDGMSCVDKDL